MDEMEFDPTSHPHRRHNLLVNEWVLVSPQRTLRPWMGQTESRPDLEQPAYDPNCYLCPGNTRVSGNTNPSYDSTFVFDNDFPAVLPGSVKLSMHGSEHLQMEPTSGQCKVVCFSPRHNLTLAAIQDRLLAQLSEEVTRVAAQEYDTDWQGIPPPPMPGEEGGSGI